MPLKKCSVDKKSGWKWGDSGHCYTGPDGKKKAIKQGYAIDPKNFKKEISASVNNGNLTKEEILDILCSEPDLTTAEIESLMVVAEVGVATAMEIFDKRAKLNE